ncbi:MAG: hypothetical protein GX817_01250, partial [Elusimicrobia bacterium]|nr:hypothetical protein [Elusimicrobiota bacterium]
MKIKLKFGFLTAILLVSVLSFNLLAATPGLQYLKLPVFATSEAMGGAYTALPGDAPAVFYNPAGISLGEREYFSFSAGQNNWIEEVCKRSFVFVLPSHILT